MKSYVFATAVAALVSVSGANAADLSYKDAPAGGYITPWHLAAGDVLVRARAVGVLPDDEFSNWKVGGQRTRGLDAELTNSVIPEVDITYFLTRNIAVEVIAGVTPHDIDGRAGLKGKDIGSTWLLPPTVTLQYHLDTGTAFKPYVGAGPNYSVFFGEEDGAGYSGLKLKNAWGVAVQAGFDYKLTGNWFLNFDVKKIWLDTTASTNLGGAPVRVDVNIDPLLIGGGIGYHFGGDHVPLK